MKATYKMDKKGYLRLFDIDRFWKNINKKIWSKNLDIHNRKTKKHIIKYTYYKNDIEYRSYYRIEWNYNVFFTRLIQAVNY